MSLFEFVAIDRQGHKTAGTLDAPTRLAALQQVTQKGLTPVVVKEQDAAVRHAAAGRAPGRVSQADVEAFIREMANLLSAGVPLSRALAILTREASSAGARRQWEAIRDDVVGGASLADAAARWPGSFSRVQTAMIRAGETGGFLETVLSQIADFRARENELKSKVKGALIYPAVLAVLAVGVLIFLLTYFIPRFSSIFDEFGESLPALTRAVIAASRGVTEYALPLALGAVLAVVLARRSLQGQGGRRMLERFLLRLPGVGTVLARFALVRFCRMLGTLLGAAVPLVAALRVARDSLGNQMLADAMDAAIEQVQRGASLARSLASCRQLFPPSACEMIAVAEESGRMDKELVRLAGAYEGDLDRRLRMLIALAEPAMLFVMAAVVGTVVIGMLLPVFTLQDFIR